MKSKMMNFSGLKTVMLFVFLLGSSMVMAQGAPGKGTPPSGNFGCQNIPDLTVKQKEQIKTIQMELMKKTQHIQNLINEKRARLRTLTTEDKPNQKAINKIIDEIAGEKAKLQKLRMKSRLDIRALLTDEQKVYFDRRAGNRMGQGRMGKGQRGPARKGQGRGQGRGNCPRY